MSLVLPSWSTACPDWRERIVARQSLVPFEPLFPAEAEAALEIYRDLRLIDVAGRPTMAEACEPWAFDLPRALFGSYDAETGRRLIRYFFELIAKKNTKSTRAAGIMITALIRNWRDSGEFYILAPTKEIADNSFFPARDMVLASERLQQILHVQPSHRLITHRNTGAFLKVVAADTGTVGGKKTIGLLIDELWQFGAITDADAMIREASGGLASRPEGFVIYLSTQSDEEPSGVFKQRLEQFRDIRDGNIIDPRSLPVIYEYPEEMIASGEYRDPKNFYIPNPNLGKSVDIEFILDQLATAKRSGPGELINAEAKFLNVEVGLSKKKDYWRGADYWKANADRTLTLDALIARSEVATIGFDVGGLDDLFGLAVIGREKVTRQWLLWAKAYCVANVLEVRKEIAPRLRDFQKEGSLVIREKPGEIIPLIIADIAKVKDAGLLPEKKAVGFDPNSVAAMIEALAGIGVTGEMLVRLLQGPALSPAIWGMEHKLSDGTLTHCGSDLMDWVVGNAKVEMKANGNMITKQVAGRAKIDPLHAAFCAAIPMSWNPSRIEHIDISAWLKDAVMA